METKSLRQILKQVKSLKIFQNNDIDMNNYKSPTNIIAKNNKVTYNP